jgi:hypothetical protein
MTFLDTKLRKCSSSGSLLTADKPKVIYLEFRRSTFYKNNKKHKKEIKVMYF